MRQNSYCGSSIENARAMAKDSGSSLLQKYDPTADGKSVGTHAGQGLAGGEKDNRKSTFLFPVTLLTYPSRYGII